MQAQVRAGVKSSVNSHEPQTDSTQHRHDADENTSTLLWIYDFKN